MGQVSGCAPQNTETGVPPPGDIRQAAGLLSGRVPGVVWLIAAVFVAAELAVSDRYGFQQDELYFLVAGHHLAFGYVDQPALTPLLTRVTGVLGVSPLAIRVIPALAGGAVVVIAARLAGLFGAGRPGRVLAAFATACAPVVLAAAHVDTTTPLDLLAWAAVLLCVATAVLRDRPHWWLGAGVAAGFGLENKSLLVMLLAGLGLGILTSRHRSLLRTRWPWLGAGIAAVIWAPNLAWEATHGWPQLVMASVLHHENATIADYVGGLPAQLIYPGLLAAPLLIAGFVRLWRDPELRFIAVTATLIVVYVLVWVPGKGYYSDGMVPAVLAAGATSAERWAARGRRPRVRWGLALAAPLVGFAVTLPSVLPILPVRDVHDIANINKTDPTMVNSIGWPQFTRAVVAQDAALVRAGHPPTSVFTGWYGEAGALEVLGGGNHLPPVLSGHNAFWMWGPGQASDRTVLVVDALGQLRPYFASCQLLTTYNAPYHVSNDWTGLQIGVCTGPAAGWRALWPHLRHYQ